MTLNAEFRQRMPKELHEKVKKMAESLGMSVNSYINHVIESKNIEDRVTDLERRILEIEQNSRKE